MLASRFFFSAAAQMSWTYDLRYITDQEEILETDPMASFVPDMCVTCSNGLKL